jgi:AcrR family transcriptional regulator
MVQADQKVAQILDAALPVFVRFGFRKTSMADIARAAGISRASLYLSFSSKEDLFRAGSARAHTRTMEEVEAALAGQGSALGRIEKAITAFQRGLIAPFGGSADAEELFEANMALAADITLAARAKLLSMLTQTLIDAAANKEIDFDAVQGQPAQLAKIIVAAMDGIKHAQGDGAKLETDTRLFMRLLQAAMTPRAGRT